jgi:hypothetical protein
LIDASTALPYIESGLPVIMGLRPQSGGHAVVAIGYSGATFLNPGELIIHNDNTGPYLKLPLSAPSMQAYALEHCEALIIPLPENIFMTASEAEKQACNLLSNLINLFKQVLGSVSVTPERQLRTRTYMLSRHTFRRWAMQNPDIGQPVQNIYRTTQLPNHLWVVEVHDAEYGGQGQPSLVGEMVFDAAADASHQDGLLFVRLHLKTFFQNQANTGLLIEWDASKGALTRQIFSPCKPVMGNRTPWENK